MVDMFSSCLHNNDSSLDKSPEYFMAKLRLYFSKTFSYFLKMCGRKEGYVAC